MISQTYLRELTYKVMGAAIEVHRELGPGLLESVYERCLLRELELRGLRVESQVKVPIFYKGESVGEPLKLDLLIEGCLLIELKVVQELLPIHEAQLLSYMKLAGKCKGVLLNFKVDNISRNAVHMVTEEYRQLPE